MSLFPLSKDDRELSAKARQALSDLKDWSRREDSGDVHERAWRRMAEAGFFGLVAPKAFGGSGRGMLAFSLVMEELGRLGAGGILPVVAAISAIGIERYGNAELQRRFLPRIAAGHSRVCLGVTEEKSGFNTFGIETGARKQGDRYVVNGSKIYISGVDIADFILLLVRTTSIEECEQLGLPKTAGFSLLLVDAQSRGIRRDVMRTRGEGAVRQFRLAFEDLEVPASNLLGEEGKAIGALFDLVNGERLLVSAMLVGSSEYCLGIACSHARERRVFGDQPIGSYQSIQHPLADVKIRQEAARLMTYQVARAFDDGADLKTLGYWSSALKYLTAELGGKAVDAAIETLGGRGFDEDYGVIQLLEFMRLAKTAPISGALILNGVAESVLGLPRSY